MNKVIEYIIGAKDATGNAIKSALGRIKSFASSVGSNLMNIKAGFEMLSGVVRRFAGVFGAAIKEAFKFEKAQSDFTGLLNSADKAKEHIADLRQFASSTPLTFGDLSQASKLLLSFGTSVEDVMPSMKMLGDIAMGDAQKFQGLSLVFAQVKSAGKLMGQDLLQMINQGFNPLTVISQQTGKSMGELKDMMAEGAISFDMVAEAMRVATSEGGLFNNAMANASKTGEGLMSTLQDKWTDAVRTFGEAFMDDAKVGIQAVIDKLTELIEDGTIEDWAEKIAGAVEEAKETFEGLYQAMHKVGDNDPADTFDKSRGASGNILTFLGNTWAGLGSIGAGIHGMLTGEGFGDSQLAYMALHGYGEEADKAARMLSESKNAKGEWDGDIDIREANAEYEEEIRNQAKERQEEQAAESERKRIAEEAKIRESLAEGQRKIEERNAEAAAKKYAEEYEKYQREIAEEEERERIEMERAIAKERERLQKATLEQYRKGLASAQSAESDAQAWLANAQANEAQAWGWYRDKDAWKAQLAEEKAQAEAEVQFEKDFEHLKRFRSNWRTNTKLSADEEIVRRVGLAREERQQAEDYARQTAEECARAADALESIEQAINEGDTE